MNILDSLLNIVRRLFGADPVTTTEDIEAVSLSDNRYRELTGYNLTAIFAGRLSTLTVTDSTVEVIGDNARAQLLDGPIQNVWLKARKWVATAYGTGGVLLIPYVVKSRIYVDIVPQSSMLINRVNGDDLRAVSIVADTTIQDKKRYFRWTDYSLDDNNILTIRQRATDDSGNRAISLTSIIEWANIPEEMTIAGVEYLPLAYVKNPTDARNTDALYGVPVTYGCDDKIREIVECQEDIRREYKLKKPIVGMDQTLFKTENGYRHLPVTGLFMPVTPSGLNTSGKLWDVYDPAIRTSSYYTRLEKLCGELEKQVGTSRGILTEPATHGATATEIKAANYDTYAIVDTMRKTVANAMERLAYAMNVLANAYGLSPLGDYQLTFDWSYDMIESSQESFQQMLSSVTVDAVEAAELRRFSFPEESLDEARERVAEIKRQKADLSDEIMKAALAAESRRPLTLEDEVDEG